VDYCIAVKLVKFRYLVLTLVK